MSDYQNTLNQDDAILINPHYKKFANDVVWQKEWIREEESLLSLVKRFRDVNIARTTELNTMSKRFIVSHIDGHTKNENETLSFTWLNNAGVTIPVYIVDEPTVPLKISSKRNQLKLFHEDVGLLTYLFADSSLKLQLLNGDIDMNYGSIYENVVAELLRTHGFDELYYYNNKKNGEVDFLVEKNGRVLPLEIKSGKNYKRHKALNNILRVENYNINEGYVFHNDNFEKKDNVLYFPIYTIEFLKKR